MTAYAGPADGTIRIDTRIDESGFNAGVENMEDVIESGFAEMNESMDTTSWLTTLMAALPAIKGFFGKIIASATAVTPVLGALASGLLGIGFAVYKVFGLVGNVIDRVRGVIQKLTAEITTRFKASIENFFKRLKFIFNYFARIVFRSLVFEFIRAIRKVIETSHEINNMQSAVEELNKSIEYMVSDLISYVFPNFNTFIQKLIDIVNIIRQVIAALRGQSTYTKIVAKDMGEAGKAAKEAAGALAAFDEIDVLQQPSDSSGGGGDGGFGEEEVPIDDRWVELAEKIAAILATIKSKILELWDTIKPFRDFVVQTATDFYNSFLKPIAEWIIGPGWDEFIRITDELMQNSDWDGLAESLDRFYKAAAVLTIAVFEGLLIFYDRFLRPIAEWTINEGLPTFLDALSEAIENIDWENLNEHWGNFLDKLTEFTILNLDNLLAFVTDILIPIGQWVIDEALPRFFDTLGNVLDILTGVLEALEPAWEKFKENILKPIVEWTADKFLEFWDALNEKLEKFAAWIRENPEKVQNFFVILGLVGAAMVLLLVLAMIPLLALFAGFVVVLAIVAVLLLVVMGIVGFLLVVFGLFILLLLAIPILIVLTVLKFIESVGGMKEAWILLVEYLKQKWIDFFTKVHEIIQNIKQFFSELGEDISRIWDEAIEAIKLAVANWMTNMQGHIDNLKLWFSTAWDNIKTWFSDAVGNMKTRWDTFTGNIKTGFRTAINAVIGFFEKFINGAIDGINALIDRINAIKFTFPTITIFGQTFGGGGFSGLGIPKMGRISIPRLAEGAVIPPNAEFLAMMGDQKFGKNIETPEHLMRQIVREELENMGGREVTINFAGSLGALVRELKPYIDKENRRVGTSLVRGIQ